MSSSFVILFFSLHALLVIQVSCLKPLNMVIEPLKEPESHTEQEWEAIYRNIMTPHLDFEPQGQQPQPEDAGEFSWMRIIGGVTASPGQFPWQVRIQMDGLIFACGGSLIAPNWVLSAAHCVHSFTNFTISMGMININAKRTIVNTTLKFVHPEYSEVSLNNDIALLKFSPPASIDQNIIKSVRLPSKKQASINSIGTFGVISGWGLTDDNGTMSSDLHFTKLLVTSGRTCVDMYGSYYFQPSNLCVKTKGGKYPKNICQGDSGGALVYQETDRSWTEIGIVSFSSASCEDGKPSAFTRVASYLGWISDITGLRIRS